MRQYLCENWLYIVAPLVLVAVGIVILILTRSGEASPFVYPI